MAKNFNNVVDFYEHLHNSTFLQNMNKGLTIPDPNKMSNGLFFNVGQMQYNKQEQQLKPISNMYTDSAKTQSYGASSIKNLLGDK